MAETEPSGDILYPPAPEPHTIEIELTNRCNARCVFCPHSRMTRGKGVMDLAEFESFLCRLDGDRLTWWLNRQARSLAFPRVVFAGLGDPFLHPAPEEFVRLCSRRGLATQLVTNAIAATPRRLDKVKEAGLESLAISLHTLDEDVYAELVGVPLSRVLPNVLAGAEIFLEAGRQVELWRISPPGGMRRPEGDEEAFSELLCRYPGLRMLGPSEAWDRDGTVSCAQHGVPFDYPAAGIRCGLAYFTLSVSWDGEVALCCVDFHRRSVPMGNAFTDHLRELAMRRHLICDGDEPAVCRTCRRWPDLQYADLFRRHIAPIRQHRLSEQLSCRRPIFGMD